MSKWYKLDNAAKIFPPTTSNYDPKIFRFSVNLKEEINTNNLNIALKKTLEEFPIFKSVLKKGLFWYYLETTDLSPIIREEDSFPCEKLKSPLLFEITYYKNKINLEVYHALSDGTGCIMFFQVLISYYLSLTYNINIKENFNSSSNYEKESDSFDAYYNPKTKIKLENRKNTHVLKGKWYPEAKLKVITGVTSTSKVKELSKKYNTTITGLLISLLIQSIGKTLTIKERKKEISITVPINLRKHFKSYTVRNFFGVTNINYHYKKDNTSLEEVIKSVDKDLKNNLTEEEINNKMNRMIALEHFFLLRLIPLPIKNIVLNFSYKITRKKQTMGLSNVGLITLEEKYHKYVDSFTVFNSTDSKEICICSFNDRLNLSFSSLLINSEIEKNFFRELNKLGLEIDIYTNEIGGQDE